MDNSTDTYKIVRFRLNNESYALNVYKVYEVIIPPKITEIPNMPDYVPGVINLRGEVIPVIDLKHKMGLKKTELDLDTRIIVVEFSDQKENKRSVGVLADQVSDVLTVKKSELHTPPDMGTRIRQELLHGLLKVDDDKFLMYLNLDKLMTADEIIHAVEKADAMDEESEDNGQEKNKDQDNSKSKEAASESASS